ncbi:hypothetical protein Bca52824_018852 [Brassica carinata]|uniref:Uncharacterized protein n=1 Tax=Brassica carinata TaxID=52824 RepID=A0A8X8AXX2_BRACI|nr:hypothetical protein Bca52824_018852 [Brassica carinata]
MGYDIGPNPAIFHSPVNNNVFLVVIEESTQGESTFSAERRQDSSPTGDVESKPPEPIVKSNVLVPYKDLESPQQVSSSFVAESDLGNGDDDEVKKRPAFDYMERVQPNINASKIVMNRFLLSLLFVGEDVAQGVGYSTKITHIELVEMAEHRKKLEKMTKPVLDTLRSYQDLPLSEHVSRDKKSVACGSV